MNDGNVKISIIIPYFQRERGILRRALGSVLRQRLPSGVAADIIVVDDGSPVAAQAEAEGMVFSCPFRFAIVAQPNGGVAAARNTGLGSVDPATKYIAFLDSDDVWHDEHLNRGIAALERGYDFYFCDNDRDGHHDSHFLSCGGLVGGHKKTAPADAIVELSGEEFSTAVLRGMATQVSTTMYRRDIAPGLLFDTSMKNAGEDVLFFMRLAGKAARICFSPEAMVHCGEGVNIFFGNLDWDSEGYVRRLADNMKAHVLIRQTIDLKKDNSKWNNRFITSLRRDFAFHSLRRFVKTRGKWPAEMKELARNDKWFYAWFTACAFQAVVGRALGLYRPG